MDNLVIKQGNLKEYTFVLCTRDYRKIGKLSGIKTDTIEVSGNLNSANEISISIVKQNLLEPEAENILSEEEYEKYLNRRELLWVQIVDHKLLWVKELDEYYEITVTLSDSQETVKHIYAKSLCESELSQYNITLEINTEDDILRDDYKITTFCNFADPEASLLHRIISDKAPHYTIGHVDDSLCKIQRTFSVSATSIYDFLTGEVSEQFNCLFLFDSSTRTISAYDLYTTCTNIVEKTDEDGNTYLTTCGYRGDFYEECPECGNTDRSKMIHYGKDTTILVNTKNLTDEISLNTNADSLKNCLRMEAGDDLMTATVRLLNQNGSDYLYYLSENQLNDMPDDLVKLLQQYEKDYDSYTEEYQKNLEVMYQVTDDILYLESGMMPTRDNGEITAKTEADKLTEENLSPMGLSSVIKTTSVSTVNSALKNYAKVYAKSGYVKIEVVDGATFEYNGLNENDHLTYGTWKGRLKVTNYSDEEDIVITDLLTIIVHDDYQTFVSQKVLKTLAEESDEDSIFDVLAIENIENFKKALTYYSRNRLQSFYEAIQGALDILIQLNQSNTESQLYNVLYVPYYEKLQACQAEIDIRQAEIDDKQKELDAANEVIENIQKTLNFKNYLGEYYYKIYSAYRREDVYSNSNYISDGLNNVELIDRAKEFIETAKKELQKAAEPQFTIEATLKNLLVLPEFKPIRKHFELGNWIRIQVNEEIYVLRIIGYSINFGSIENLSVQFSTVSRLKNTINDTQQVIKAAQSISTSFSYVAKQAEKGKEAKSDIDDWCNNGLNNALVQIKNNEDSDIVQNEHGILCRYKDKDTGEYSPKQMKILYNNIVFTNNSWQTCAQAIGEHSYTVYNPDTNKTETYVGYGVTAEFFSAPYMSGKTIIGGMIYSTNYSDGTNSREKAGTVINLNDGTFSFAGGRLLFDGSDLIISDKIIGDALAKIEITAENLNINANNIQGLITSDQIKSLDTSKLIGAIDASKISGTVESSKTANSVNASNINGTISSAQIAQKLESKTVTGAFSGTVAASAISVVDNSNTYIGLTTDIVLDNTTLHFVNGILVNQTTN